MVDDMDNAGSEATVEDLEPLPNLFMRIVMVFVAPGQLFERLRDNPVWLWAMVLLVAVGLVASALVPAQLIEDLMMAQMPEGASEADVERAVAIGGVLRFAGVLFTPIAIAIIAGVLMLVFNVFMGGEARFKQLFSVATYTWFIPMLGGIAVLPLIISKGDLTAGLNLGLLAPGLEGGFLSRFLTSVNIFSLWGAVVLGIGMSKLYPERSAKSASIIILVIYALYVAISAALSRGA